MNKILSTKLVIFFAVMLCGVVSLGIGIYAMTRELPVWFGVYVNTNVNTRLEIAVDSGEFMPFFDNKNTDENFGLYDAGLHRTGDLLSIPLENLTSSTILHLKIYNYSTEKALNAGISVTDDSIGAAIYGNDVQNIKPATTETNDYSAVNYKIMNFQVNVLFQDTPVELELNLTLSDFDSTRYEFGTYVSGNPFGQEAVFGEGNADSITAWAGYKYIAFDNEPMVRWSILGAGVNAQNDYLPTNATCLTEASNKEIMEGELNENEVLLLREQSIGSGTWKSDLTNFNFNYLSSDAKINVDIFYNLNLAQFAEKIKNKDLLTMTQSSSYSGYETLIGLKIFLLGGSNDSFSYRIYLDSNLLRKYYANWWSRSGTGNYYSNNSVYCFGGISGSRQAPLASVIALYRPCMVFDLSEELASL